MRSDTFVFLALAYLANAVISSATTTRNSTVIDKRRRADALEREVNIHRTHARMRRGGG